MTQVDWHPYPEEMPKLFWKYLVTVKLEDGELMTEADLFCSNEWICYGEEVIAWAELPEPYNQETKETDDANS